MSGNVPSRLRAAGGAVGAVVAGLWIVAFPSTAVEPPTTPQSRSNAPHSVLPPLPPARSPIDFFRELLTLSPTRQREQLANRPPEVQRQILAKIREYEALSPTERELRLRTTELRCYLLPVLKLTSTNRSAYLAATPEHVRPLVEGRLNAWDMVPADLQQLLLQTEAAIREAREARASSYPTASNLPSNREELESAKQRWQQLSEEQRAQLLGRFEQFFSLDQHEQMASLQTLSESERRQIEQTIKSFSSLSPAQRSQCLRALQKYMELSVGERMQFLSNVERWKLMSPEQRQAWRETVAKLSSQPPLPPGAQGGVRLPPPPPGRVPVTNGN